MFFADLTVTMEMWTWTASTAQTPSIGNTWKLWKKRKRAREENDILMGYLYHQALADVRSTGAEIKCLWCMLTPSIAHNRCVRLCCLYRLAPVYNHVAECTHAVAERTGASLLFDLKVLSSTGGSFQWVNPFIVNNPEMWTPTNREIGLSRFRQRERDRRRWCHHRMCWRHRFPHSSGLRRSRNPT